MWRNIVLFTVPAVVTVGLFWIGGMEFERNRLTVLVLLTGIWVGMYSVTTFGRFRDEKED